MHRSWDPRSAAIAYAYVGQPRPNTAHPHNAPPGVESATHSLVGGQVAPHQDASPRTDGLLSTAHGCSSAVGRTGASASAMRVLGTGLHCGCGGLRTPWRGCSRDQHVRSTPPARHPGAKTSHGVELALLVDFTHCPRLGALPPFPGHTAVAHRNGRHITRFLPVTDLPLERQEDLGMPFALGRADSGSPGGLRVRGVTAQRAWRSRRAWDTRSGGGFGRRLDPPPPDPLQQGDPRRGGERGSPNGPAPGG